MSRGTYNRPSPLDEIDDVSIDAMISQVGPMEPIQIARFVGLSSGRIQQILNDAQGKALRTLARRGFTSVNIDDLFSDGRMDVSYWRNR